MTAVVELTIPQAAQLSQEVLRSNGLGEAHALAIASLVCRAQVDDCQSHGLYRLLDCVRTLRAGDVSPDALPAISQPSDVVVRVDANGAFAPVSFSTGLPIFAEKTRRHGIAVMALNNCCHFSALWAEVEDLATQGLAAIVMLPSHSYVAPAGGTRPLFGTNPFAFGWPRPGKNPYVFDFATSVVARGEIELHRLAGKSIPEGWAIDQHGQPTTDPVAALAGAMLTFGGHKGSALATMIELLAGPLINDATSQESLAAAGSPGSTPRRGELAIAFDPLILGGETARNVDRAESLFAAIESQGARLPSDRRYSK